VATIKIYAPRHSKAVYEVHLPFYDNGKQEKYWAAFCFRGGRGVNKEGLSLSDPNALFMQKPQVDKDCAAARRKQDSRNQPSHGVAPARPLNVRIQQSNTTAVTIVWQKSATNGGAAIKNYRLFVTDPQGQDQALTVETPDSKPSFKLNTPAAMQGRFYSVTVQAVNANDKRSSVSDPAVFQVKVQAAQTQPARQSIHEKSS